MPAPHFMTSAHALRACFNKSTTSMWVTSFGPRRWISPSKGCSYYAFRIVRTPRVLSNLFHTRAIRNTEIQSYEVSEFIKTRITARCHRRPAERGHIDFVQSADWTAERDCRERAGHHPRSYLR